MEQAGAYKSAKSSAEADVKTNGKATVEDEDEDDGQEAGPAMPPEEADEEPEDDEGRFFGSGTTKNTTRVLDYLDEQDQSGVVGSRSELSADVQAERFASNQKRLIWDGSGSWQSTSSGEYQKIRN